MKKIMQYLVFCLYIIFPFEFLAQTSFVQHNVDFNTNGAGGLNCSDIDNDGDTDIIVAGLQDHAIILFENLGGNPINWNKKIIGGALEAHSVCVADFNLDSYLDIVSAAYKGKPGIAYWENEGQLPPTWKKFSVSDTFINAHEVFVFDIDNDTDMDILGASSDLNQISMWRNDGGTPLSWSEIIIDQNVALAKSVAAGDINNDGHVDIIGASILDNYIAWWENDGSDPQLKGIPISWEKHILDGNFLGAHKVQLIDLDKDGDLDVLGAAYIGHEIAWWRNDGGNNTLNWTKFVIKRNFKNACVAFSTDLDQDGDNDVIGSSQGNNELKIWFNNGGENPTWSEHDLDNNFNRVWPVFAADIDGDTDIDIVAATSHNGNREVRWYENLLITNVEEERDNLDNSFTLYQNYPNPFNPSTNIQFSLPASEFVNLTVYNTIGEKVSELINGYKEKGSHKIVWNASNLPNGVYFLKLTSGDLRSLKKTILLK